MRRRVTALDSLREAVEACREATRVERPAARTPSNGGSAGPVPPAMTPATGGASAGTPIAGADPPIPPERARRPWESSGAPDAPHHARPAGRRVVGHAAGAGRAAVPRVAESSQRMQTVGAIYQPAVGSASHPSSRTQPDALGGEVAPGHSCPGPPGVGRYQNPGRAGYSRAARRRRRCTQRLCTRLELVSRFKWDG